MTLAGVTLGVSQLPLCTDVECIAFHTDQATTSFLGPTDGPPTTPIVIDVLSPVTGTGGPAYVDLVPATLRLTPGSVTVTTN
jgi:hypothetical protein